MVVEIVFMPSCPRKDVLDVRIELGAVCMPSGHASDRSTAAGPLIIFYQLIKFQTPSSDSFRDILLTILKNPKILKGYNSGKMQQNKFII